MRERTKEKMNDNKMDGRKRIRWIIIGLLAVFAAMSFAPCINQLSHWIPQNDDIIPMDSISTMGYATNFCCFICGVEGILLFLSKRRGFLIVGLLLNMIKTFLPFWLYISDALAVYGGGGIISPKYYLNWPGYLIIGVGILTAFMYILAVIVCKEPKATA